MQNNKKIKTLSKVRKIDLGEFEFRDDKALGWLRLKIQNLTGLRKIIPPIKYKDKQKKDIIWIPLETIGEVLGFNEPELQEYLKYHQTRHKNYRDLAYWVYMGCVFILSLPVILGFQSLSAMSFLVWVPFFLLYTSVIAGLSLKIAFTSINKNYSDSLCVAAILNLLLELNRDNTLRTDKRSLLLTRIDYLARNTILISWKHANEDTKNQAWFNEHFEGIEKYIRNYERLIIAPKENTLQEISKGIRKLAPMYITGMFGDFLHSKIKPTPTLEAENSWKRYLTNLLPKMTSILLPIILLLVLIWQPELIKTLGIKIDILALILISWLLLAIDAVFGLGIVKNLAQLVKEIRELA